MASRSQGRYSAVPAFQVGLNTAPRRPPRLCGQRSGASTALRITSHGPAVGGLAGKPLQLKRNTYSRPSLAVTPMKTLGHAMLIRRQRLSATPARNAGLVTSARSAFSSGAINEVPPPAPEEHH